MHDDDGSPTSQCTRMLGVCIWFDSRGDERGPMRGTLARLGGHVIGAFHSMAEFTALIDLAPAPSDAADSPPPVRPRI
ncbi:MAG: hypothetical protein ACRC67_26880 [Inquilinus sp.]|uniref:hypothetical protein n=1 Tax=Inquilinus sp. TaxID=1932117 RepID=UPI003F3BF5F2